MKILSIEPLSGAAGDMILASLIDLGADPQQITEQLKSAGLTDFSLHFQRVSSCFFAGTGSDYSGTDRHISLHAYTIIMTTITI